MRRWASKVDANQGEIMAALQKVGAHPVSLHEVGRGVCDLMVMFRGAVHLFEIKANSAAVKRKGKTADDQREFRDRARECGVHVWIVTSAEEALRAIGAIQGGA